MSFSSGSLFLAARSQSQDLFQPWQLTLGAAAQLLARLAILVDLTYARWSEFRIWQDANGDGISQSSEVKTLADRGIAAITWSHRKRRLPQPHQ